MSYARNMNIRPGNSSKNGQSGERELLRSLRAQAAGRSRGGLRLGIGDDCALLAPRAGEELAVTTDLSIAGRHFRLDWHSPESVGHRALARGLSDLAAMGARPVAAFLSLGVPRELTADRRGGCWVDRFLKGLLDLAAAYKTPLAGGDLAESPLAVADIVLVGAVERGKALLRSGARPGDLLFVSGVLGGAACGLKRLEEFAGNLHKEEEGKAPTAPQPPRIPKRLEALLAPHLRPQPRIAQGMWLRKRGLASAALDISDGLSTDLAHLCEESGVAAEIDTASLPLAPGTSLELALHGGEDYELLFTAPAATRLPRSIQGVAITPIGRILKARAGQPAITLVGGQGRAPLAVRGWEHFS
jgi:thiamine-monophosphate kinase